MSPFIVLCIYSILIAAVSLLGGWIPSVIRITHVRMQIMMSLVSGLMLGVALLHLLPHSLEMLGNVQLVGGGMLAGILVMFFLMRLFHVHHHSEESQDHHRDHEQCDGDQHQHECSCYGLFFGMAVHTILDGFALASSAAIESRESEGISLIAFGTFLAVLLHKPLDALSITSLMQRSGVSKQYQLLANLSFALACPLGVFLFWIGAFNWFAETHLVIGLTLAFSTGFFLCIALADLLPEVHFHSHDRGKLSMSLVVGILLAFLIELSHLHGEETGHHSDIGTKETQLRKTE
ncbi:MAG: ZIP family metal transporter [Planctomycetota bacterium]|nr:ZIP family metal transporter [Planctomycetota bacterium]